MNKDTAITENYFTIKSQCLNVDQSILWISTLSEAVVATACFSIPLVAFIALRKHKETLFFKIYAVFMPFLLFSGMTHFFSVLAFWTPVYQLESTVKTLAAGISVATTILLLPLIRQALEQNSSTPPQIPESREEGFIHS